MRIEAQLFHFCPHTDLYKTNSDVSVTTIPADEIIVVQEFGCGAFIVSDSNKFLNSCPDCGAGWTNFTIGFNTNNKKAMEAVANWVPPLQFKSNAVY